MRITRSDLLTVDLGRLRPLVATPEEFFASGEHYRLLAHLSTRVRGGPIVDVGTHRGDSALALSYGGGRVFSLDVEDRAGGRPHPDNVTRHIDDVFTPAGRARWESILLGSSIIFVDVDPHDGERERELVKWLQGRDYRGLIVLDDIWHFKAMRDHLWYRIEPKYRTDATAVGHWSGTGIVSFGDRVDVEGDGKPGDTDDWTLVTGYFDLTKKSDASDAIRARPASHYLDDHAASVLSLDQNLVVFCEPETLDKVWSMRPAWLHHRTRVVVQAFEDFPLARYRDRIVANRGGGWCERDPRNTASYYLFCMARYAMVKRAIADNPFSSTHFAWINVCIERMGYKNLVHLPDALRRHRRRFSTCFIDYVSEERAGDLAAYFGPHGCAHGCAAGCTMCSGFFTGDAEHMGAVCTEVEREFVRCVEAGYGHADEQLFPLVYYRRPDLFDWYVGDYTEMVTNYDRVREHPERPVRNLLANSLAAGDAAVAKRAAGMLLESHDGEYCTLDEADLRAVRRVYGAADVQSLPVRAENAEAVGYVSTTPEEGLAQLDLLLSLGCLPGHRVMEIGCGALVAGYPVMQFLRPGNYTGVDPNAWLRAASQRLPGVSAEVDARRATFHTREDFRADDGEFDFIFSHSILSHASDAQLTDFFEAAAEQLKDDGALAASVRLAEGNSVGSPGSPVHGSHFTEWQYPGVSWFTEADVLVRADRAGLRARVAPELTRTVMSGNPRAVHDWVVARPKRMTLVTAFFRLPDRRVDEYAAFARFDRLAASGLPIVLFLDEALVGMAPRASNVDVVPLRLTDLWPFQAKKLDHRPLPIGATAGKDTRDFLRLQNAKVEMLAMADRLLPEAGPTHLAWVDFSVMKVVRHPESFFARLRSLRGKALHAGVTAPGCWTPDRAAMAPPYTVNWRFCGGFLVVDRPAVPAFAAAHRAALLDSGVLTWEVNVWREVELAAQSFPMRWYQADHDDSLVGAPPASAVAPPRAQATEAIQNPTVTWAKPVLIGTPCFQESPDLLRAAVQSMLDPIARVVVVDNGSSDACKGVLAELGADVEVIANEVNWYVNAAWNQLAERFLASEAELLVIANADAVLSRGWAPLLLARSRSGPPAVWHGSGVVDRAELDSADARLTGHSAGVLFALSRADVARCFPIPSEIKIFYGDTWVFDLLARLGREQEVVSGVRVWHAGSVSSRRTPEFATVVARDTAVWDAYLRAACALAADPLLAGDALELRYRAVCAAPSDISEHLPLLRALAAECDRVTEFGVGRSTWAFAAARPKSLRSYDPAPDVGRGFSDGVEAVVVGAGVDMRFTRASDLEVEIEPTDLLFIDTLHTGSQLARELATHAGKASRYVVLHDTETFGAVGEDGATPGLRGALDAFLAEHPEWSVMQHRPNNNGLTVLSRAPEAPPRARPTRSPSVCLVMIVKNESAIIERCLSAALPYVDSWVITDTGSTDGTPDRIQAFFANHGVPGVLHREPFRDFAQARNASLDAARAVPGWDYALLIDADMVVRGSLDRAELVAPAYEVRQTDGSIDYANTRLVRRDVPAAYVGVTHEYLSVEGVTTLRCDFSVDDRNDGGSKADKSDRDIRLLSEGLAVDPHNGRYMFYLANTYREVGRHREAVQWYTRRIEAGGWDEEIWSSHYGIARSYQAMGDEPNFVKACLDAYEFRPSRAEPVKLLARHFRERGRSETAMLFAEALSEIDRTTDKLFVEFAAYDGGAEQEAAIAGFYSRLPRRREASYRACVDLTTHPNAALRGEARTNLLHHVRSADRLFGATTHPIDWRPDDGYAPMNPSVVVQGSRRLALVRTVNYTMTEEGQYPTVDGGGVIRTRNHVVEFDDSWCAVRSWRVVDATGVPRTDFPVEGFEDCRLWSRGGGWCLSATVRDISPGGECEMAVVTLDDRWCAVSVDVARDFDPDRPQKNWMPIADCPGSFVYLCHPTVVVARDGGVTREVSRHEPMGVHLGELRGGSHVVAIAEGWLALVHEVVWRTPKQRVYLHRFVRFDRDFRLTALSDPFYFTKVGVEFCAGLALDPRTLMLVASFGVDDASAHLAHFDPDRVIAALRPVG